jgi:hypothetical protein
MFQRVARYLNSNPPTIPSSSPDQRDRMQSFVESYFSNYIEGTKFVIEEALKIVNSRSPQEFREDDSHDVIGTFDAIEASKANPTMPDTTEGFEALLPTVFREDYILALKALSNEGHAEPYVRMLTTAAKFSALLDYATPDRVFVQLDKSNAKKEPDVAKLNLGALP